MGFFEGDARMSLKLQNFGYAQVQVEAENPLIEKGIKINCHEFHKSYVELNEQTLYTVNKITFENKLISWKCGYYKNNTIATYAHIHFWGNFDFFKNFLK